MSLFRATVRDDRGRVMGLIEPTRTSLDSVGRSALPKLIRTELRHRIIRRCGGMMYFTAVATAAIRIFAFHSISSNGLLNTFPVPFVLLLSAPMLFYLLINSNIGWARRYRENIQLAAVAAKMWATCLYGLNTMPVEADGCTVCPERGSAWRLAMRAMNNLARTESGALNSLSFRKAPPATP